MLTLESLKEFTNKFQTMGKNVAREYIQHLFLSFLYKLPETEKLLFKGGTALRFVYLSPRFSEDLDFTGENIFHHELIETLFINTLSEIEKQGIQIDLRRSGPTTGGYLGIIHYELYDFIEDMKFEVSLRRAKGADKEITTIINDYVPPYTIISLPPVAMVKGKMDALLSRGKPRDYYDLYFFLRHPELHRYVDKNNFKKVLQALEKDQINFRTDLSDLLPKSHQIILKDFKSNLIKEIKRFV